jgi:hypothetical protein
MIAHSYVNNCFHRKYLIFQGKSLSLSLSLSIYIYIYIYTASTSSDFDLDDAPFDDSKVCLFVCACACACACVFVCVCVCVCVYNWCFPSFFLSIFPFFGRFPQKSAVQFAHTGGTKSRVLWGKRIGSSEEQKVRTRTLFPRGPYSINFVSQRTLFYKFPRGPYSIKE